MPISACVIQRLDKSASDIPATLKHASELHPDSDALDSLVTRLTDAYHGKAKRWGRLNEHAPPSTTDRPIVQNSDASGEDVAPWDDEDSSATGTSGAGSSGLTASDEGPVVATTSRFPAEFRAFLDGERDFQALARELGEAIKGVVDAHLPTGGHLLMVDQRQGETRHLFVALVHHRDGFVIGEDGRVGITGQLNHSQMSLAFRLNLTQWQDGGPSSQYLSMLADRGAKKLADDLQALLGASEGVDPKSETRTLLKAFSDYVEQEDMEEEASREKTDALIDYAQDQASRGEAMTLDELSALVNDDNPRAFYEHIRNADYGLSPEIPPDKRTLNQFRRFTGRAEGVSISFDSHLLGNSIEYDEEHDRLIIKKLPSKLKEQLQGG
ncbi:nucleoid-associated protein [Halomonas denitrificans]|uniref:nucleoid-associated protein n=1 Tax=Halomonas denitrificans TaxID=370769 RepID=UPI001C9A085A|nr:nucleoid-associated protein [Halomonas denitrificans]MBY5969466.1 nucleoid-associated protein [Halomonas denitrificans]